MKTSPYPSGKGKVKWVSTEWLAEHQNDNDLMILDIQPNVHDYIMGHLSNAIYLNEGFLRSSWNRLPSMFVPPEAIQPVFNRIGLDPNKPAVIYSGAGRYSKCTAGLGDGLEQTMMAYSLIRFGHNKVYILDGGIEKWKEEGRELTKVFPHWEPSEFKVQVQKEYFVEYEEFKRYEGSRGCDFIRCASIRFLQGRRPMDHERAHPWSNQPALEELDDQR